ncbi:MAG: glycosyltransferase, partial [Rhodospirillales bacterium]|nr:glycosyltransferase [Rhodospirillales bacterium]
GPIEALARVVPNVVIVPWQSEETLGNYISAADVLLIPPSFQPLAKFGSTVLPLKLFFYLGSGRPILAGNTPDVAEVLKHDETAWLCAPDDLEALVAGLRTLTEDAAMAARLAAGAAEDSRNYTWSARAEKIFDTVSAWLGDATTAKPGHWGAAQSAVWKRESRRWWGHVVRTRNVVLPPGP